MNKPLQVLIVEDSESDTILLLSLLRQAGYDPQFRRAGTPEALRTALAAQKWDLVLSDHSMPGFDSRAALAIVRGVDRDLPFIIVSGMIGDEAAVAAMKAGAQDYLMKSNLSRLAAAVARELEEVENRRARREAEQALLAQQQELRIARDVQQRLFPVAAPAPAGCDLAGYSCPAADTGGDYFDFIPDPGGGLYVVVGDVTGHGLGPALLMADVRAYLRALVLTARGPADVLAQLRRLLAPDLDQEQFITLGLVHFDAARNAWVHLGAGHPPAYLLGPDGALKAEIPSVTSALGIDADPHASLAPAAIPAQKGDVLLLMTDGVYEARAPEGGEFGEARVLDLVRRERACRATDIVRKLLAAVCLHCGPEGAEDDMTVVVLKF